MRVKPRTILTVWALIIILLVLWAVKSNALSIDLTGGAVSTKSMALWEIHKYKSTKMMRKSPLCYEPFKAWVLVDQYVHIECKDNLYHLTVDADLKALLADDVAYNKAFAKRFKVSGSTKHRVKQIYRYCRQTEYAPHVKTAHQVFSTRQGDCAGIASAFYVLCKVKHIPVRYIIGWTSDGCHAWNRVKVNGRWYWIDCTQGRWIKRKLWKHYEIMEQW